MQGLEHPVVSSNSDVLIVGRISGVFGIKGWLKVKSFTDPPENIVSFAKWRLIDKLSGLDCAVEQHQFRPQGLIVKFKGVDDRTAAEGLIKKDIGILRSELPALPPEEYYWDQLLGLDVLSEYSGKQYHLGRVAQMLETGANDVIVVRPTADSIDESERLVPFVIDHYVKAVDLEAGHIVVDWDPEF